MTARGWCTLVVRTLGLWIAAMYFTRVLWVVLELTRSLLGREALDRPELNFWDAAFRAGDVLVFLLGTWMLIDGRMLIDHLQGISRRQRGDAPPADSSDQTNPT